LEALSSGCSVVSRPVGIVPEFKSLESVLVVSFDESLSEFIKNKNTHLYTNSQQNDLLDLNSWDRLINIYKYFFKSVMNHSVDFKQYNDRYSVLNDTDLKITMPKLKYKATVYLDWLKYGNTKI
jgi:hypothetical protein